MRALAGLRLEVVLLRHMFVGATPHGKARMTKLAIVLLALGMFLFVDHQHWLLPAGMYCQIGAGELRETQPQARDAASGQATSQATKQYCLHGSIWDTIMGRHNWYQDSNP
jgi:hypothetical protein